MKPEQLLTLYPRKWRRRYAAEMAGVLAHERLTAQLIVDVLRGAIDAHLHPELAAPLLAAAGGGTVQIPPRSPRVRVYVLAVVVLVLLLFGSLYPFRTETPAFPPVALSRALADVEAGLVSSIEVVDSHATLTLADGRREQVTVTSGPQLDPLQSAVLEHNRVDPAHRINLAYRSSNDGLALVILPLFTFVITALPIALLAWLVLLLANRFSGGRRQQRNMARYEWLARIAELRDRGVLSEDEFQREKERLLG